jgi:hypothetical protein
MLLKQPRRRTMKRMLSAFAMAAALVATDASAQGVNLTGQYRCVYLCADGLLGTPTFVTQYGWDMNLVNEVGQPVRAWVDWPGHIWVERWSQGAVYSPDGMAIQFDRGTVWQRDIGQFDTGYSLPPKARPAVRARAASAPAPTAPAVRTRTATAPVRSAPSAAARTTTFDGSWSVLIVTESGLCDRSYRYGVQITNGNVSSGSASGATLQGRVAPNGNVQVNVSAGGQSAEGQGRMSPNIGTGTWSGQGPGGGCAGTWLAQRSG